MKRLFAVALMLVGIVGVAALVWPEQSSVDFDEAKVNAKVDQRLHQVLGGLLDTERQANVGHTHAEMAALRFGSR